MMANFGLIDIQVHCQRVCFVNNKTYECAVAKSRIYVQKQRHVVLEHEFENIEEASISRRFFDL